MKRKSLQGDSWTFKFNGGQTDKERRITEHKHEIYIEYTDNRFDEAGKICDFSSLCDLFYLQSLNLILVTSYG